MGERASRPDLVDAPATVPTGKDPAWVARRVDALEGLRGWLALIVCWTHASEILLPALDSRGPSHLGVESLVRRSPIAVLFAADLAVRIFFVHSGFVLSLKFFRTGDRRWPETMAARRAVRLGVPVFAASMIAFAMTAMVPSRFAQVEAISHSSMPGPAPHVGFLTALGDGAFGHMILSHSRLPGAWWTMPVEFYCSIALLGCLIMWPSINPVVRRIAVVVFIGAIFVHATTTTTTPPLNYSNVSQAFDLLTLLSVAFLGGALLAHFWANDSALFKPKSRGSRALWWIVGGGALLVGTFPSTASPFVLHRPEVLQLVVLGMSVLLVAFVLATPVVRSWFETPLSRWLGRISFMLYLVHVAVQRTVMDRVFLAAHDAGAPYSVAAAVAFVTSMAVILALAHVLAMTIDRWSISFGKKRLPKALGLSR